jgi:hypothetical protein
VYGATFLDHEERSDLLASANVSSKPLIAYVLSANQVRWESTEALLRRCGLRPVRVIPVPLTSPHIAQDPAILKHKEGSKMLSNKLTQLEIHGRIACDTSLGDYDASMIFEDDVALHENLDPALVVPAMRAGIVVAAAVGVVFAGLCHPACREDRGASGWAVPDTIAFAHCSGRCLHAYAVLKWRAAGLYDELVRTAKAKLKPSYFALDAFTSLGARTWATRPVFVGSNLVNEHAEQPDHLGIFWQDRRKFPSEMYKYEKGGPPVSAPLPATALADTSLRPPALFGAPAAPATHH